MLNIKLIKHEDAKTAEFNAHVSGDVTDLLMEYAVLTGLLLRDLNSDLEEGSEELTVTQLMELVLSMEDVVEEVLNGAVIASEETSEEG